MRARSSLARFEPRKTSVTHACGPFRPERANLSSCVPCFASSLPRLWVEGSEDSRKQVEEGGIRLGRELVRELHAEKSAVMRVVTIRTSRHRASFVAARRAEVGRGRFAAALPSFFLTLHAISTDVSHNRNRGARG